MISPGHEVMRMMDRVPEDGRANEDGQFLFKGMWSDIIGRKVVLITDRAGRMTLTHGLAAVAIVHFLIGCDLRILALTKDDKSPLDLGEAVVLLGDVEELTNPVVSALLRKIDYHPLSVSGETRSESEDSGGEAASEPRDLATDNFGFVYKATVKNLSKLPVLVISGNSPLGVLAAAAWATDGLRRSRINVPGEFPNRPIEAAVHPLAQTDDGGAPDASPFVMTHKLKCGHDYYDLATERWVTESGHTVGLTSDKEGDHKQIHVAKSPLNYKPGTDSFELIWLLADKQTWLSMVDAAREIDGVEVPLKGRVQTLTARMGEIRRQHPGLVRCQEDMENHRKLYRINARSVIRKPPPPDPKQPS